VIVKELEDRHQRFDLLIHKAQSAASHALTNSAVHEGSAYDYKVPVATTPDGSKHNSLPTVSEDTSYSAPLSTLGYVGSRSSKGSTTALKSDITVNSPAKILPQAAPTAGIAFLHALILMVLDYGSYVIVSSNQRRHAGCRFFLAGCDLLLVDTPGSFNLIKCWEFLTVACNRLV
jgi:hypothetical protein